MTTHFTSQFRRPIGLLAALSLVVSVFVFSPATTTAQTDDPVPDYLAGFDACPESVIPSSSFRDVSSRHPIGDINCIAYYGITMGTSATTYRPDDPVIREHMALFLVRMAKRVGIDLPPADSFTPFTDIGHLSQESREAIAQIYQLRITIGATANTYDPERNVSRDEMALFLKRLMNRMDPVADGRTAYGYIPDDVDDNIGRFDIESPYNDLNTVSVEAFDAVTQLYELGVGSGVTSSLYGPDRDMSRAAMAEFMAGILDHSNLRPAGAIVQVTPANGLDNFDITMMISVRDPEFAPVDNQPVDWFYSDDEDGGLVRGLCVDDLIQPARADCLWTSDDDDTDRDGNIFEDRIEATPGETMTFYAWIGRRDREEFDRRVAEFSGAQAHSAMGPSSINVTWRERDIPPNAWRLPDESYVVDLNIDSIDFTIQLRDDEGNNLELEGIEVEVEVESRDIAPVFTAVDSTTNRPAPDPRPFGSWDESETTVITDDDGEAFFELFAPRRDERLDVVTFRPNCDRCSNVSVRIAWSEVDPVLVSARPVFDFTQIQSSSTSLRFQVRYQLYDQYGEQVSGVSTSHTGRTGAVVAFLVDEFYGVASGGELEDLTGTDSTVSRNRGAFLKTASATIPSGNTHVGFLLVLKPRIFHDADDSGDLDAGEVRYLGHDVDEYEDAVVVWFVKEASSHEGKPSTCTVEWPGALSAAPEIEVIPDQREFRTCFTLWRYDTNDRFLIDGQNASLEEFEQRLASPTLQYSGLSIITYSDRSGGRSIFQIS